jgi:hypothetical protein
MSKNRELIFLIPSLLFLVPLNVYVYDRIGAGVQWALFRYQVIGGGGSLYSFTSDFVYMVDGLIPWRSNAATTVWFLSVSLLIVSFLLILWGMQTDSQQWFRRSAIIVTFCGVLFLCSDTLLYGIFFYGPGGFCIPVGIPLVIILGVWAYFSNGTRESAAEPVPVPFMEEIRDDQVSLLQKILQLLKNRELLSLIVISIIIKTIVFFSGLVPNMPLYVASYDTRLYYWYATCLLHGQIPYVNYLVEYPQMFFIPALIPLIPTLAVQNYLVYLYSFSFLMVVADTATLIIVYLIAARLFGQKNAFMCGFLYSTAISAAFFIPIEYDAVPTFMLMLSLWAFLYQDEIVSFVCATISFLMKWFAIFSFPYYFLYGYKTGQDRKTRNKAIAISVLLVAVTVLPFIILDYQNFLITYTVQIFRPPEIHSLVYYMNTISTFFFHQTPFEPISVIMLITFEVVLLFWFYRYLDTTPQTLISLVFLSIFAFVLFNKVFSATYIIWLTPFLALLLFDSNRKIVLFYLVQLVMYLETPLLFGIVYGYDTNLHHISGYTVLENSLPSVPFLFYTVKFVLLFVVVYVIIRNVAKDHYEDREPKRSNG